MDLASMMKTMLSTDSIAQMSEKTGTSPDEVKSVLLSALPAMLNGVQGQASNQDTVAGFAGALDAHALDDTSNISEFLSHVGKRSSATCWAGIRLRRLRPPPRKPVSALRPPAAFSALSLPCS